MSCIFKTRTQKHSDTRERGKNAGMQGNQTLPNKPWDLFGSHKFQTWQLTKFPRDLSYNAYKIQITYYLNSQHIIGYLQSNAHLVGGGILRIDAHVLLSFMFY